MKKNSEQLCRLS